MKLFITTIPDKTRRDTLQKYLLFCTCPDKNTRYLPSQIKRPFPPSPIAMLFAVTQEMRMGWGGGDFVPFRRDGCMAQN